MFTNNLLSIITWLPALGAILILALGFFLKEQNGWIKKFATGWLVLAVQGLIVWLAGFCLAPVLSKLLAIPADLQSEFIALMRWQTTTLAFNFVIRIFSHILLAHQRMDLSECQRRTDRRHRTAIALRHEPDIPGPRRAGAR